MGEAVSEAIATREPVPAPDYPRGSIWPARARSYGATHITFELALADAVVTYHDAQVVTDTDQGVQVFVGPHDVVTWEWR